MGAAEVAGAVRARALARRRVGPAATRRLAGCPSLAAAVDALAEGPYGRQVHRGQTLAQAETATLQTLLWHLRMLAGWQSRTAAAPVRLLAAAFELANVDEQVLRCDGGAAADPFDLGALAVAWPRLAQASTRAELRDALAHSFWGDPGADSGWALTTVPRLVWLRRVAERIPVAAGWAGGAALLILAREQIIRGRPLDAAAVAAARPLAGPGCLAATTVGALRDAADRRARWALDGVSGPEDLWRAEARWWGTVEKEGLQLVRGAGFTGKVAVGCAAVLAADAWRVRVALASAVRGGGFLDVFDAID
ncbi:hypothetical protein EV385_5318 [Krasilnikovia cinnamomea]|uniref:Uncharacterized protein n=1 Tax=Krasilnikovia cinnamomea TaxID=349313 RepID=A0A4Q7ZSB0_9ACTN|nr:hypothetical protein [Krasilnikovia cinnamomea]RZU53395.1 hypothetical protein EV385_5318 [Krasilnikovia cinnamomea]